jgi:hypothetical protein
MLGRIFPRRIDTDYRGYQLAVWLLVLLLLGRTLASVNAMGLNPEWPAREVLRGVYGIPLIAFSADAADTAVWLYARWGVTHLTFTVLGFIAVVRYRAMVPLIYLLMAFDFVGMKAFGDTPLSVSTGRVGVAPMPLIGIAVTLIGFGLSLTTPRRPR